MSEIIAYQPELRPALATVYGPYDYREFRRMFEHIDDLIDRSALVAKFISLSMKDNKNKNACLSPAFVKHSERALRCTIARMLIGVSYRKFSERLADSQVLQWFCRVGELEAVNVPAKSTLQRYLSRIEHEQLDSLIYDFLKDCALEVDEQSGHKFGLEETLDFDTVYSDGTCLKAHIHFPVDWVLLVDAVRTLMKATLLIRDRGLKHRMCAPQKFISQMNALGIQMTCAYRQAGSKKQRKSTLRLMKKLVDKVASHARKHRELLQAHQNETNLYPGQVGQILERIDQVLEQLPVAKKQAHERIIGERKIDNADKMLSLYESDVNLIVRKKAGHEVEFGNLLTLCEQKDGLLVGWHLHQKLTSDQNFIPTALDKVQTGLGRKIKRLFTDRGYNGPTNANYLQEQHIYNGICPKDPEELRARKHSSVFIHGQKRRAGLEGPSAFLKTTLRPIQCVAKALKSKGKQSVGPCSLTTFGSLPASSESKNYKNKTKPLNSPQDQCLPCVSWLQIYEKHSNNTQLSPRSSLNSSHRIKSKTKKFRLFRKIRG